MGKLWPLFLTLALICAVLNPHVGLFGLFILVELLVCFSLTVNIRHQIGLHGFYLTENGADEYSAALQSSGNAWINVLRVLSIVFFIICTVVGCGVWLLASGRASALITARDMAPFSLFVPEFKDIASIILLVASVGFNLLATVTIIIRCKQFTGLLKGVQEAP